MGQGKPAVIRNRQELAADIQVEAGQIINDLMQAGHNYCLVSSVIAFSEPASTLVYINLNGTMESTFLRV